MTGSDLFSFLITIEYIKVYGNISVSISDIFGNKLMRSYGGSASVT